MNLPTQPMPSLAYVDDVHAPISICLLGNFALHKAGQRVVLRPGGKSEALLSQLGIQHRHGISCTSLLQLLWPTHDMALAHQSLHSVVHSLHKLVGDAIGNAAPIYHDEGCYRLNFAAGVTVDVANFDILTQAGDQQMRNGDLASAVRHYQHASDLYRGDLCVDTDIHALMERERLRARYLTLLAQLSDYHYAIGDYKTCLDYAWRLLGHDPCREDAHRLVMRCYVRQGERAGALRQYQICVRTLRSEFATDPEIATTSLFEQIRFDPGSV
ncbi:MAG: bacterial transcriptional activator domain-containing protein [Caldilineaceae bacterium]